MAEVIKYGIIWDDLFAQMEQCAIAWINYATWKASHCKKSSRSCNKADVVSKDEKKQGSGQFQLWSHHWSCCRKLNWLSFIQSW